MTNPNLFNLPLQNIFQNSFEEWKKNRNLKDEGSQLVLSEEQTIFLQNFIKVKLNNNDEKKEMQPMLRIDSAVEFEAVTALTGSQVFIQSINKLESIDKNNAKIQESINPYLDSLRKITDIKILGSSPWWSQSYLATK